MMSRPRAKLLVASNTTKSVLEETGLPTNGFEGVWDVISIGITANSESMDFAFGYDPAKTSEHARRSAGIEEFLETGCWPGMWNPEPDACDDLFKKHLCRPGAFTGLGDEGVARPRFLLLLLSLLVLWLLMWLLSVLLWLWLCLRLLFFLVVC